MLEVLGSASLSDACAVLCEDYLVLDIMVVSNVAESLCHILDIAEFDPGSLFRTRLYKMIQDLDSIPRMSSSKKKSLTKLLYSVSEGSQSDNEGLTTSYSISHVSSTFLIAILDEGENSSKNTHSSHVNLIGKNCLSCVRWSVDFIFFPYFLAWTEFSSLSFQAISAFGFVRRWMAFANPEREHSGSEGPVIISCRKVYRSIEIDTTFINNITPARRLPALNPRPLTLFVQDSSSTHRLPHLRSRACALRSRACAWLKVKWSLIQGFERSWSSLECAC